MKEKYEKLGFDVDSAAARFGSEDIFMKLLPAFALDIRNNMELLERSVKEGNFDECRRILHSVSGVAATMNHSGIKDGSEKLGRVLKNGNADETAKETEQYIKYCSGIIDRL